MAAFQGRNPLILYLPFIVIGSFVLSYFTVGREMNVIIVGLVAICLFIVCFFSVKISLVLLIFSMLLSPELEVGQTVKREITVRAEDLLLTVMTLGWLFRIAIYKDIGFTMKNYLNMPILVYCFLAILSTSLGIMRGNVDVSSGLLFTIKIIEYFVLFFVVINYVKEEDINILITSILLVAGIICIYALISVVTGTTGEMQAPFEGERAERNTLSGYLVLTASIAAGVLLSSSSRWEKTAITIFLPLVLIVLLFSISRSGWVAAIVATFVLFLNARHKGLFFIIICIGVALLPFVFPSVASERINFTFHQVTQNTDLFRQFEIFGIRLDTSSSARIYSAITLFKRFIEHPFFGFGITGYPFIDGQFVRTLAEMGIFGFSALLWLMVNVHRTIRRVMKAAISERINGLAMGFYAGFWGLMVHALTANTFIIVRISEPFWCVCGILIVALNRFKERQMQENNGVPAAAGV
ncbi:MAG: O-antigen ligase family protein [Chitinispirillaceae bacterium]|nr:O-antigen ligase family protein [Chitinispirillaceae bacterium]